MGFSPLAEYAQSMAERVSDMTREEVVQAALVVERWCISTDCCDCPFVRDRDVGGCKLRSKYEPRGWGL